MVEMLRVTIYFLAEQSEVKRLRGKVKLGQRAKADV